ncbi:MAG: hypothetical protein PQJ60_12420 [Spirochaetales bacterium]|nr:hypothetical protein [Spirochaetales bacterium]
MGWPKYLKKSYSREDLEKKILKKLQLAHDREFLAGLFVSEGEEWHLKADLTKEESKRLKKIVGEIKKGKGGFKVLPLVLLLIFVGGGLIFALFFKNPLVDRYLEDSLESLFEATADVEGVKVSLLKTEVRWDRVAVTDRSDLDRNLFEVGETVLKLNSSALLQKKIVIDSLVCRGTAWDTLRDEPGRPISSGDGGSAGSDGSGGGNSGNGGDDSKEDEKGGLLAPENFQTEQTEMVSQAVRDPEKFVDEQWDSLQTPALAEELREKYERELADRKASLEKIRDDSKSVTEDGRALLNRDFSDYVDNPARIPELVKEGEDFYKEADRAIGEVNGEIQAVETLRYSLQEDKAALLKAKEEDIARVKSLVTLPEGGVKEVVSDMVQSYLYSLLGEKYVKGKKIAQFIKKYRQEGAEEKGEGDDSRRSGRTVEFDTTLWPDLLLQKGAISAAGEGISWDLSLNDVAAEADQWDHPVSGRLSWVIGEGYLEGDGLWERRSTVDEASGGDFRFAGLPLSTEALAGLGISRAQGAAGGTSLLTVEKGGDWELVSQVVVLDPQLEKSGDDLVADVVYSVLSGEDWEMTLTASGEGEDISFGLDWPLLSQVDDKIGALLKEQAEEFLDDVQEELLDRYAGELDFMDDYLGDLDDWGSLLEGDLSSLDSVEDRINDKIDDVKDEAESRATEKVEEVLEDLGVDDAVKDVQDALPKSLPKLF